MFMAVWAVPSAVPGNHQQLNRFLADGGDADCVICGQVTATDAPSSSSRARASLSAASTSRGGQGAHDVTDPGIRAVPGPARRLASGTGGFYRIPDTSSTRRVIRTTAMMIRPMRTMARSLPVTPG
jgi:hypothetical protein